MSKENVEVVRRLYGFWRVRDYSTLQEAVDPEAVLDVSRNVFNPGTRRGIDAMRVFVTQIDDIWVNFEITPEEYIDAGDKVVVANRISGEGRGSGVETEMLRFAVVAFRDGRILQFTGGFRDRAEALEAAGIEE